MNMHRPMQAARVVTATTALVLGSASMAAAAPNQAQDDLASARAATAAYHDVSNVPANYQDSGLPCMQTSTGGMGIHYLDADATFNDPSESATHPEALVYAETQHGLRLVAVEYIVPAADVDPANPPSLFGQTFHEVLVPTPNGDLDLYVLHAWIWQHNPAGMFQDWNSALDTCPEP